MGKKNNIELYNIIMPLWLLYLFPSMWFIVIPSNFVLDLLFLTVAMKIVGTSNLLINIKKTILKTWILGFVADFIGCMVMIPMGLGEFGNGNAIVSQIREHLMVNPCSNTYSFIWTTLCVLVAAAFIYLFNYKIALKETELDIKQRKKVAIFMAIFTAPYLFFFPAIQ